jgi:hypothetical protein
MSLLDDATAYQEQALNAIKAGQDTILAAHRFAAESVSPLTSLLPEAPAGLQGLSPQDVAHLWFSFAEKVLASQREFTSELTKVWTQATS